MKKPARTRKGNGVLEYRSVGVGNEIRVRSS